MRPKIISISVGLCIGLVFFTCLSSDKHLPLILMAIALPLAIASNCTNQVKMAGANLMAIVSMTLLALVPLALFSPVDMRFRRDRSIGIRFLPVTYSTEKLSKDELDRAIQDPETLMRDADPKNEVRIYRSAMLNRAYYSVVIDLP